MNEGTMDQGQGGGAATTLEQGAAGTQGGYGQQGGHVQQYTQQQGQNGQPWETDQRFRGKQAGDVWKSYTELEKKLGGMPDMEKRLQQWEQFGKAWNPYLEAVGYDPQRLAQSLEAAARAARSQGRPQEAQQLQQQAQEAWADAMTPQDQEKWIGDRVTQVQQQSRQEMQQVATSIVDYMNRFGDLAIRAIQQMFMQLPENVRPKVGINDILQEAVNISTNRYDPLDWAMKIKTAEDPEQMEARIRADERAKAEAELKNRSLTTFSGVGTGSPRTLRPRNTPTQPAQQEAPLRVPGVGSLGGARERFANKWTEIAQP